MNLLTNVSRALRNHYTESSRLRARALLLRMSDSELTDFGYSREKLEAGIHAWPWRVDSTEQNATISAPPARDIRRAIEELSAYSDRELADLGIARYGIADAVRHGRPTVEAAVVAADRQRAA